MKPLDVQIDFAGSIEDEARLPSTTHQTVRSDIRVSANVRLDNEVFLRKTFDLPRATLDEVLTAGYLAWDEGLAQRLSGDFAIVIHDLRRRRLVAIRDPLGIRPLFYRTLGRTIHIADSVGALANALRSPILDDRRIVEYLVGTSQTRSATFFRDIHELPAAHLLVATGNSAHSRRYWSPVDDGSIGSRATREDSYEEFRRLFIASVEKRLKSASPVLLHVSGGLDSSSIAGAADQIVRSGQLPAPAVRGVAAVYPGLPCDESAYIDAVAENVRFPIERWDGTQSVPLDLVEPSLAQPGVRAISRGGAIGDVEIARAQGASVILAGIGGDEVGWIVGTARDLVRDSEWARAFRELFFFPGASNEGRLIRLKALLGPSLPFAWRSWRSRARATPPPWLATSFSSLARDLATPEPTPKGLGSDVAAQLAQRLTSPRLQRVLTEAHEHAAMFGVTYRFPFLDQELISFMLSVPYQHWPRETLYGRFHRSALRDLLPQKVQRRYGKAEFTPALVLRIQKASRSIEALLESGPWLSEKYIDRRAAIGLYRMVSTSRPRGARAWLALWAIVTLEAWHRAVLKYHT